MTDVLVVSHVPVLVSLIVPQVSMASLVSLVSDVPMVTGHCGVLSACYVFSVSSVYSSISNNSIYSNISNKSLYSNISNDSIYSNITYTCFCTRRCIIVKYLNYLVHLPFSSLWL